VVAVTDDETLRSAIAAHLHAHANESSRFISVSGDSRLRRSGQRAGFRRRRARVQIAAATLSGNSLRQTVHTHRAAVHQTKKLVAALLRVARLTAGLAEVMAAYRRVYDSRHLQADCQEPDQLRNLGNPVWATGTFVVATYGRKLTLKLRSNSKQSGESM